jgi:hypothetical protein
MDMWTAAAEPDHISTAPTTAPLIMRRRPEDDVIHTVVGKENFI